jgi:hypothetical protein
MGFLDKLFGRSKATAEDVGDKAAPAADKAQDSSAQAWEKTSDAAGDAADEAKDKASGLGGGDEAASGPDSSAA